MILGDACLRLHGNNAYLQIKQKDKEFVYHLYNQFKSIGIVGAPQIELQSIIKPSGNTRISYHFMTYTLSFFTVAYGHFIQNGGLWPVQRDGKNIKIIPHNIGEFLTPIALAYWISGDGSYCKRFHFVVICTDSFTLTEVNILRSALLDNFGIDSTQILSGNKAKDKFRIRIPKREIPKLQALVKDIMPPMTRYRIGLPQNHSLPDS